MSGKYVNTLSKSVIRLIGELIAIKLTLNLVDVRFWLIGVPVFVAFVAILFIGEWIGWTMATTPPPKPIEEITTEPSTEIERKTRKPYKNNHFCNSFSTSNRFIINKTT